MFLKKEVPDNCLSLGEQFVRKVSRDLKFMQYRYNKKQVIEEVKKKI